MKIPREPEVGDQPRRRGSVRETRARWESGRVPGNLVRLGVGLEDVDEVWADLERALEH